jgi:hypothetical protein
MQTAKQLSVTLVNKPGRLAATLAALHKEKVGVLALTVTDSGDRGMLRFVPDDAALASSALETINVRFELADVLMVEVANQSGAFVKICERLASEHLNIDYAYSSFSAGKKAKGGLAIIKVNDLAKASRVLASDAANGQRAKSNGRRPLHTRRERTPWSVGGRD